MRFGVSFFLVLLCSDVFAKDIQEEAGPWAESSLSQTYLSQFIDNQKCYSNAEYLLSCVNALNSAGQLLTPPRQMTPNDLVFLASMETPRPQPTWERIYSEKRRETMRLREFAAFHFTAAQKNPTVRLDFESAIERLAQSAPQGMPAQMVRGYALAGHLQIFDSHADVVPSKLLQLRQKRSQKSFIGAGLNLDFLSHSVLVHEVFPDSPAARAGLLPDDRVTAIAPTGEEMVAVEGRDPEELYALLVGEEHVPLALTIERAGRTSVIHFVRGTVRIQTIYGELLGPKRDVGYIRLRSFESLETCRAVNAQIQRLTTQGAKRLILDLRGNSGGEKTMAVCVASLFIGPDKPILGTKSQEANIPSLAAYFKPLLDTKNGIVWENGAVPQATALPLLVLVNALSASASELVAAALQEYGRAWLVGERSAGKGSVQVVRAPPDNSSIAISRTVARFYAAHSRAIQIQGVEPNFDVPLRQFSTAADRFYPREADLYPFALAEESREWRDPRSVQAEIIRNCTEDLRKEWPQSRPPQGNARTDYQLDYSLAILNCL